MPFLLIPVLTEPSLSKLSSFHFSSYPPYFSSSFSSSLSHSALTFVSPLSWASCFLGTRRRSKIALSRLENSHKDFSHKFSLHIVAQNRSSRQRFDSNRNNNNNNNNGNGNGKNNKSSNRNNNNSSYSNPHIYDNKAHATDTFARTPVPRNQVPVLEFEELSNSFPASWGRLGNSGLYSRVLATTSLATTLLGLPVAYEDYHLFHNTYHAAASAAAVGLGLTNVITARIWLTWSYLNKRLTAEKVEYERTGWYDGQFWEKPVLVTMRDRLVASTVVSPILQRVTKTFRLSLVAFLIALLCLPIANFIDPQHDPNKLSNLISPVITPEGPVYRKGAPGLSDVLYSDEQQAQQEADAQNGIPGFCADYYHRSFSSLSDVCDKLLQQRINETTTNSMTAH